MEVFAMEQPTLVGFGFEEVGEICVDLEFGGFVWSVV